MGEEECSECERDQDCTSSVQLHVFCFVGTDRSITSLEDRQVLIQTSSQELAGHASRLGIAISVNVYWQRISTVHFLPCSIILGQFPLMYFVFLCLTHVDTQKRLWEQAIGYATYIPPLPLFSFLWTFFSMTETSMLNLIFSTPTIVPSLSSKETSGLSLTNKQKNVFFSNFIFQLDWTSCAEVLPIYSFLNGARINLTRYCRKVLVDF